jgi:RNA polymerase sigma-70 factor (ECF subfamily)
MQMDRDRDLFWQLLEPEYLRGMMFCRKLMRDRDNGDDLYQDVLFTAYTKFGDLKDTGAFRTWFYRILINMFKSTIRRPWWKRRITLTDEMESNLAGENPIDRHTAGRWLERAFKAVSLEDQTLVTLHEIEGWNVKELAGLYGATEGSIKARLFRARNKMKKALKKFTRRSGLKMGATTGYQKECRCNAVKPNAE